MAETNLLMIGGRAFAPVEDTTFLHDVHLTQIVRRAALDDLARYGDLSDRARGIELLTDIYASGETFNLLGAVLKPAEHAWTPEVAAESAAFFAEVTDPASKQILQQALVTLLLGFILGAGSSSLTSLSSSAPDPTSPAAASEGSSPSATGGPSSARSPATTPSGRGKSSGGRSGKASSRTSST